MTSPHPTRSTLALALAALLGTAAAAQGPTQALDTPGLLSRIKLSETVKAVKFAGDLRLRHDSSYKRGAATNDRARLRVRLRIGAELQLPNDLSGHLRFATGAGEQVSTNQSFDNLSSQKDFRVDLVYLRWAPALREGLKGSALAGRMHNPLWRAYSSDLIWDDDFNPEGLAQGVEWSVPGTKTALFANAMQMVADEDSDSGKNQWLFSYQAGVKAELPADNRLSLALAYHKWSDENRSSFGATTFNDGNRRTLNTTAGILLNRFRIGEFTAEWAAKPWKTPVALQATLARNFGARNNNTNILGPVARDGYQFGVVAGKAAKARHWEAAYFKKYSQSDLTVADVADSDFGDGGTNRSGHILWLAYAPNDWVVLKTKYLVTDAIDRTLAPGDKAINRLQVEAQMKF